MQLHRGPLLLLLSWLSSSSVTAFLPLKSPSQRRPSPTVAVDLQRGLRRAATFPQPPISLSVIDSKLYSSTDEETSVVPLVVEGKNIEITEALMEHVNKRLGGPLKKLGKNVVRECDVVLSVSKNPKVKNGHRVEVVANLKGTTVICNFESPDMYASIDSAAHALYRKLMKYKERRQDGWHGGSHMGEDFLEEALEELESEMAISDANGMEEFVDPEAPQVTKINSFDLKNKISVQEAIFALDYIDHDFYVFRSEETDNITVVYKRHGGGIGLIEP